MTGLNEGLAIKSSQILTIFITLNISFNFILVFE